MMIRSALVASLLFVTSASAQSISAVVDLVPRTAGPYQVGDVLEVDVFLRQPAGVDSLLRNITLNFSATSGSGVELQNYIWSWTGQGLCAQDPSLCGFAYTIDAQFPTVEVNYIESNESQVCQLMLPAQSQILVGRLTLEILSGASTSGAWIEALSASSATGSTSIQSGFPPVQFDAFSGDITGQPLVLIEGPNNSVPAASNIGLALMVASILGINRYLRKRRNLEEAA